MGLKFERTDDLEKLFESFAVDPKKVSLPNQEKETKKDAKDALDEARAKK